MSDYKERLSDWKKQSDERVKSSIKFLLKSDGYEGDEYTPLIESIVAREDITDKQKETLCRHLAFYLKGIIMLKYLLPAWKDAIDKKIAEECDKFENDQESNSDHKAVWYNISCWLSKEIEDHNILDEFRPFAHSYMKQHIKEKLDSYKLYRSYK